MGVPTDHDEEGSHKISRATMVLLRRVKSPFGRHSSRGESPQRSHREERGRKKELKLPPVKTRKTTAQGISAAYDVPFEKVWDWSDVPIMVAVSSTESADDVSQVTMGETIDRPLTPRPRPKAFRPKRSVRNVPVPPRPFIQPALSLNPIPTTDEDWPSDEEGEMKTKAKPQKVAKGDLLPTAFDAPGSCEGSSDSTQRLDSSPKDQDATGVAHASALTFHNSCSPTSAVVANGLILPEDEERDPAPEPPGGGVWHHYCLV